MTSTLWIVRHGNRQDFVNPEWRASAALPHDPGLSPDGHEQAQRVGERLRGEGIGHIFASPYLRTVQTAHHIAEALDLRVYLEPGIGEWLNAAWFDAVPERRTLERLAEEYPRIEVDYTPVLEPRFPETVEETIARAGEAARRLTGAYPGTVLLVGHGASVTGAVRGLVEPEEAFDTPLCSLFKLVRAEGEEGWRMDLCGDVSHLGHSEDAGTRWN